MKEVSVNLSIMPILLVVFIVMKVAGVIEWSWWWVFCPVWIPLAFILFICLIYGIVPKFRGKKKPKK